MLPAVQHGDKSEWIGCNALKLHFNGFGLLQCVHSTHGLVTTVAYKMGQDKPVVYALEGSVAVAGVAMKWLRNNLGLLEDIPTDSEKVNRTCSMVE